VQYDVADLFIYFLRHTELLRAQHFSLLSATSLRANLSNNSMTDDRALISRTLRGDMQAFTLLIRQHERLVAHMISRLVKNDEEREELCQDVFLKVYEKLAEFNFQSRLSTWIATIAYRHAINHMRKKKLLYTAIPEDESYTAHFTEDVNPESLMEDTDMDTFVMKLVDLLPTNYKLVLTLYHVEGMSYEEIGAVTNMPEGTVKNYIFRARTLLKEKVKSILPKEEWL
jgi:RNA polymerase sigma factor (sigma-70 family)